MDATSVITPENVHLARRIIEFLAEGSVRDPVAERLFELSSVVEEVEKEVEATILDVPTWKRIYLEEGGAKCWHCKSTDISVDRLSLSHDTRFCRARVKCDDCGREWTDWYKRVDVEPARKEDREHKETQSAHK